MAKQHLDRTAIENEHLVCCTAARLCVQVFVLELPLCPLGQDSLGQIAMSMGLRHPHTQSDLCFT